MSHSSRDPRPGGSGARMMLAVVPMNILSGASAPLDSMPPAILHAMLVSPATHPVAISQAGAS